MLLLLLLLSRSVVSDSLRPHGLQHARPPHPSLSRQASPSFTISWSLLKLMSLESVMPSNYLILCRPLLLRPPIFPSIREGHSRTQRPSSTVHDGTGDKGCGTWSEPTSPSSSSSHRPVLPWVSPDHVSLPTNPHSVLTSSLFPAPSHHSSFPGGLLGASWRNFWPESREVPQQAGGSAHTPGTAPNSSSHEPSGSKPSGAVGQGGEALPTEARRAQGSLGKARGQRSRQSEQMWSGPQGHTVHLLQDPGGKIEAPRVSNSKLLT